MIPEPNEDETEMDYFTRIRPSLGVWDAKTHARKMFILNAIDHAEDMEDIKRILKRIVEKN